MIVPLLGPYGPLRVKQLCHYMRPTLIDLLTVIHNNNDNVDIDNDVVVTRHLRSRQVTRFSAAPHRDHEHNVDYESQR